LLSSIFGFSIIQSLTGSLTKLGHEEKLSLTHHFGASHAESARIDFMTMTNAVCYG
jgi:hypothetical protein